MAVDRPRFRIVLAASALAVVIAVGLTACSDRNARARAASESVQNLHDMTSIEALQAAFNHDLGSYRLVLLLSPT